MEAEEKEKEKESFFFLQTNNSDMFALLCFTLKWVELSQSNRPSTEKEKEKGKNIFINLNIPKKKLLLFLI